jgi:hypothetical protein
MKPDFCQTHTSLRHYHNLIHISSYQSHEGFNSISVFSHCMNGTLIQSGMVDIGCYSYYQQIYRGLIKFSRTSSHIKWLKVDKTDVSRTISILVLRQC